MNFIANNAVDVGQSANFLPKESVAGPELTAHGVLQSVFGYSAFRGLQEGVVAHAVAGGDALVLMPTGAGKSLCFQVPALVRAAQHGTAIVVSPLIALMHDQVGALKELGVSATFLNSSLDAAAARAVEQQLLAGELTLLYVAPERLTNPRMLAMLQSLCEQGRLSLFAIDEAHCVSQWGHDFRPEYRALSVLHERFPGVPRLALTATADALTRQDIVERLELQGARQFVSSFDRPNIRYRIQERQDGRQQLRRFIEAEHPGEAGIVYCQSRKKVEETAEWLTQQGIKALPYHAGLDQATRLRNQDRFIREDGWVMAATIAFGMGIDKPDVRFVAHLDMPKNIEGYYQETGRAGRDGEAADAWMLYGLQDVVNQRRMIDESPAAEAYKTVQRGKLDALLAMAEATDCRRVRLLAYFDESSQNCGNCDNCLSPAELWDASKEAQQALSCVFRVHQATGIGFGAGHIMDILRGKNTEKMRQFGHETLSTFGIGAATSEAQWRTVLRQLVAVGALHVDAQAFNTLRLEPAAKPILRGEQSVKLRASSRTAGADPAGASQGSGKKSGKLSTRSGKAWGATGDAAADGSAKKAALADLSPDEFMRFESLKAWRAEIAREHNLPAFVIFHDATLRAVATRAPQNLAELDGISGIGEKKREAYGAELLRLCAV